MLVMCVLVLRAFYFLSDPADTCRLIFCFFSLLQTAIYTNPFSFAIAIPLVPMVWSVCNTTLYSKPLFTCTLRMSAMKLEQSTSAQRDHALYLRFKIDKWPLSRHIFQEADKIFHHFS